jgi:threonine dehydratase
VPLAKILQAKQTLPKAPQRSYVVAEELWDFSSKPDYLRMILTSKVYDVASETPLQPASRLSERLGNSVFFKREDLQPGFSFKVRGAYNKMAHMRPEDMANGVVAHAVGGHAEGVAIAAHKLGVKATIVMPENTGAWKQKALERLGATVVLHGRSHQHAMEYCVALAKQSGRPLIPSYDDPLVIAGQV